MLLPQAEAERTAFEGLTERGPTHCVTWLLGSMTRQEKHPGINIHYLHKRGKAASKQFHRYTIHLGSHTGLALQCHARVVVVSNMHMLTIPNIYPSPVKDRAPPQSWGAQ